MRRLHSMGGSRIGPYLPMSTLWWRKYVGHLLPVRWTWAAAAVPLYSCDGLQGNFVNCSDLCMYTLHWQKECWIAWPAGTVNVLYCYRVDSVHYMQCTILQALQFDTIIYCHKPSNWVQAKPFTQGLWVQVGWHSIHTSCVVSQGVGMWLRVSARGARPSIM